MPAIKRFFPSLKSLSRGRYLLIAGTLTASVLLLGYSLHQAGTLPALPAMFASPATGEEQLAENAAFPIADKKHPLQKDYWPGIRQPPMRAADKAGLADDSAVLGIRAGGRARAYRLAALSGGPEFHLVNDILAGRPVSVAYCNISRCARVFTAAANDAPLDLGFAGWSEDHGPLLQIGDVRYSLEDGKNLSQSQGPPLPYERMEFELATWGDWRRSHPDTDVYVLPPPIP